MFLSNITWCSFCVKVNVVNLQECQFCNYRKQTNKKKKLQLQIWPYHKPGSPPSIGHCLSEPHIFLMCQIRKITILLNFTSVSCKSKWFMCQSFISQKGAHVKRPVLQRKEQMIRKQKTWLLGFALQTFGVSSSASPSEIIFLVCKKRGKHLIIPRVAFSSKTLLF